MGRFHTMKAPNITKQEMVLNVKQIQAEGSDSGHHEREPNYEKSTTM